MLPQLLRFLLHPQGFELFQYVGLAMCSAELDGVQACTVR
jgi:hypothetical protein